MVSVKILDVIKEDRSKGHLVLLSDETGRMLPIFVGAAEAVAIAGGLKKSRLPRPMTHDLMCSLLEKAHISISEVKISSLVEGTFYATIVFRSPEAQGTVDARPSDAVAIAVRTDAPILVSEEVMNTAALTAPESSIRGMVAILKYVNEKMKDLAATKGWRVPDLLADPSDIKATSLLADK